MTPMPRLPAGVRRLFRLRWSRAHIARDLDDELRFHLEMRISELEARGMRRVDAEVDARRRLGDVAELRAYCTAADERAARIARVGDWIADWVHDFALALRQLKRAPAFSALAVMTLALGLGANTAIFSVVHALLLDPLPYAGSDRIVGLRMQAGDGEMLFRVDKPAMHAWMARSRTLEAFSAADVGHVILGAPSDADTAVVGSISPGFLETLNIHAAAGRAFSIEEAHRSAAVAMISDAFWKARFRGTREAIGSVVRVDGQAHTIIGVIPHGTIVPFTHGKPPEIWIPHDADLLVAAGHAFARLRSGVSTDAASRELQEILATSPNPKRNAKARVRVMRSQDFLDAREVRTIEVLFAAVGVLLLIACANVASLLLGRSWLRRREFAIRSTLGAGRSRLMRQVLTESASLALSGGVIGVAIAWGTLRAIIRLRPPTLVELANVHLEPAVLAWSALISVATGILFGSIPALFAGSRAVSDALRSSGDSGTWTKGRFRSGIVVLEVALSVMLLIGATLLVRSFVALQRMPLGYEPHDLISVGTFFRGQFPSRMVKQRDAILEKLNALPGVEAAAIGGLPGEGWWRLASAIEVDGTNPVDTNGIREFSSTSISPGYFRAAGITLVAGRTLDSLGAATNGLDRKHLVSDEIVVNVALAKRLWPNGNAIGGRVRLGTLMPWSTVVGIANDVRMPGSRGDLSKLQMYTFPNPSIGGIPYTIRSKRSAPLLIPEIRRAIREAGSDVAVGTVTTGADYLRESLAPSRFSMVLLGTFALLALLLSAVALYGVIAYAVSQRTKEIGVRVALGADQRAIAQLVVGGGFKLTVLGVCFGVAGAFETTRALDSMLYGVTTSDPTSFVAIPALLGAIALLASYIPARRALRIDPVEALRSE